MQTRIEKAVRIAELENSLTDLQPQLVALNDYQTNQKDILELASLDPGNSLLGDIKQQVNQLITPEIDNLLQNGNRSDAESMVTQYQDVLSALQLNTELAQIKLAHLSGDELNKAIQNIVATNKTRIDELLANPELGDPGWESSLLSNTQELETLAAQDARINSELNPIRASIASLYVDQASSVLAEERFDAASDIIEKGERFAPGNASIAGVRNQIASAKAEFDRQQRVVSLKDEFKVMTEANKVTEANEIFQQLKTDLPESDPFIKTEAPSMLSNSYAALAKGQFDANNYSSALKLADAGLALNPGNNLLSLARGEYAVEAYAIELKSLFENQLSFDVNDVRRKFGEMEQADSTRYSSFRQEAMATLTNRINGYKESDLNSAATLAQNAAALFPGTQLATLQDTLQPEPWPESATANAAISAGEFSRALGIQEAAAADFGGHPDYVAFTESLTQKMEEANNLFSRYQESVTAAGTDYAALKESQRMLSRALAVWVDNPEFTTAESELNSLLEANRPATTNKRITREETDFSSSSVAKAEPAAGTGETSSGTTAAPEPEWRPVPSDRPCQTRLAGYGKRAKAICYDWVNSGWRGPLMVVVPAGEGFSNGFAIGKYEISNNDFSKYCAVTGKCEPVRDKELQNEPKTGITLQEAEAYVNWLSERTGKTYRLPTASEWEYAATAGGKQPSKDFNCRVALGDKVIKGTGPVSVKSGKSNGWGLKHYIGNVQEWVTGSGGNTARGGAFMDAHSKCDISLERPHSGNADDATGFRVILEEVG